MMTAAGVSYRYDREDRQAALDGVDLTVREGEWLTVLGANGSGKTTLAMLLNGLLLPDAGSVSVDGLDGARDGEALWEIRRRVAYIFQNPENQFIATTVEEDVAFGPENLGLPRAEILDRVDGALAAVGMAAYRRQAPHLLSGGQKQKVAIAGALAMAPRYLIMDEATSMLDPVSREEILAVVKGLQRQRGLAVVHISHFVEEALLSDRVAVLAAGKLALEGETLAVLAEREALARCGLKLPPFLGLGLELRERGHWQGPLPRTAAEMVEGLCRLK